MSMKWREDLIEVRPDHGKSLRRPTVHLEDIDDGRCKATSWGPARRPPGKRPTYESHFGPGGYNRCVGSEGHANPSHKDEWGHVFVIDEIGGYRTLRIEEPEPVREYETADRLP